MIPTWLIVAVLLTGTAAFLWFILTPVVEELDRHYGPDPKCVCHRKRGNA